MESNLIFRKIQISDCNEKYFNLLNQLNNTIDSNCISKLFLENFINSLHEDHQIIVIEDYKTKEIIGTGTILIETKILHNMGKVAHIEDIVIDKNRRGLGLGLKIINCLVEIAKEKKCYKVILNCSDENVPFYEKCGFCQKSKQMSLYF
jgi:glucosamine-phosphate N-acetyltransferase